MKVDFPTKEQELLVRLKLIQNSIQRVLHQVDKGTLEIPETRQCCKECIKEFNK